MEVRHNIIDHSLLKTLGKDGFNTHLLNKNGRYGQPPIHGMSSELTAV